MSTSLAVTLYDERLSNGQRLTISALMNSGRVITSARVEDNPVRLFVKLANGEHVRIDANGNAWVLGR